MGKKKKPDYYAILGITVKANDKQIKNAALKKIQQYRPDVYKGGDSEAITEEIIEARDVLLDENKRSKYDKYWLENYSQSAKQNEEEIKVREYSEPQVELATNVVNEAKATNTNKFFAFFDKLQLPKKEVNKKYPFLFKIYNWKTDGMIFLITGLIIPLIALFVLALVANMGHSDPLISMGGEDAAPMVFFAINIVSNLVGILIFWQRDSQVLIKSGFIIFYSFIFIVGIMSIIASIVLGLAVPVPAGKKLSWQPGFQIGAIWFQIVAEVIVIYLAMRQTKNLKQRILMTLKQNWLMWLITAIISGVLLFVFISYVMPAIFSGVPAIHKTSDNESQLESGLQNGSNGYRAGYAISLFILSVLVAPLTEELATRHAIFAGTSNRTLALFVGAIYFAMLHVEGGDVEHIFNYFIGGLFLSGVFSISRGNVTYDTGTHMVYNLISFIIICATKMHS